LGCNQTEEIEVASLAPHIAGERELFCFLHATMISATCC